MESSANQDFGPQTAKRKFNPSYLESGDAANAWMPEKHSGLAHLEGEGRGGVVPPRRCTTKRVEASNFEETTGNLAFRL